MRLPIPYVHRRRSLRASTWIDLLAFLFILILLTGFLLPKLAGPRRHHGAPRIKCVNNQKNLGLALRIFATDNDGKFPWMVPIAQGGSMEELGDTNRIWRHFQVISNELSTPMILRCPTSPQPGATGFGPLNPRNDQHQHPFSSNDQVSYFLTTGFVEGDTNRILAGDRNLTCNGTPIRGRIQPTTNDRFSFTKPGHHDGNGNLLFADGSVEQVSSSRAAQYFKDGLTPVGTNPPPTLLIP